MYQVRVKNHNNEVLNFTNNKNYVITRIDGLTPPNTNISKSSNATKDGSKVNSIKVEDRNIVLYIKLQGNIEESRINLYKYFPYKSNITFYYVNNHRDVYIDGVVENFECDLFTSSEVCQISIICSQPYFKSVKNMVSVFSEVSSLFEFPFSMTSQGTEISTITKNIRKSIIYTGEVETGLIIELYANGDVVNPVLYNVMKRTQLKLNISLEAGDSIVINTNDGEKSISLVRNGVKYNALGSFQPNSDWLSLVHGDNVFTFDCESGNSNLQITFTNTILYGGV